MKSAGPRTNWAIQAWLLVVLACTGCAVSVEKFAPEEGDIARFDRMTTIEAIKEVNSQLNKAQQTKLEFYAPEHFDLAAKALAEARAFLAANSPREAIVQKIAVAEAILKSGDSVAHSIKTVLAAELEVKDHLESLNAPQIFGREYESLVDRLTQIIRKVETGQSGAAKSSREALFPDMQALEARTVVYNALHEAEETIKRVSYRGGEKLAPLTFKEASEVLRRADQFIRANTHNRAAIAQISNEALFAAKRALYVTEEVASLSGKMSVSLEQVVLDEEYRLFRVARAVSGEDVRNHPLEEQSEWLAKNVKELAEKAQSQDQLVSALRDSLGDARDSATQISQIDSQLRQLQREKNTWQAKEALFQAQIDMLQTKLATAEASAANKVAATVAPLAPNAREAQLSEPAPSTALPAIAAAPPAEPENQTANVAPTPATHSVSENVELPPSQEAVVAATTPPVPGPAEDITSAPTITQAQAQDVELLPAPTPAQAPVVTVAKEPEPTAPDSFTQEHADDLPPPHGAFANNDQ